MSNQICVLAHLINNWRSIRIGGLLSEQIDSILCDLSSGDEPLTFSRVPCNIETAGRQCKHIWRSHKFWDWKRENTGTFFLPLVTDEYIIDQTCISSLNANNLPTDWKCHKMMENELSNTALNSNKYSICFRSWAWPLRSSERNSECFSIPRDFGQMLRILWKQFGDGPFLFQHDFAPVHKARSIKTWMSEFGVEELDWPAKRPDLNPIEHLGDELERRLWARPSRPTSVSNGQKFP